MKTTRSLLSSSISAKLPEWISGVLKPQPDSGDRVLVRLIFFGATAFQPLTARLVSEIGADVNILAGTIEKLQANHLVHLWFPTPQHLKQFPALTAFMRKPDLPRRCSAMSPDMLFILLWKGLLQTLHMVAISGLVGSPVGLPIGIFLATSGKGELLKRRSPTVSLV